MNEHVRMPVYRIIIATFHTLWIRLCAIIDSSLPPSLEKGAYGAIMDDETAADQFCEEDIDQILQRRTQVITVESGVKGSTFAKATFATAGTRDDIALDDPDFWEKWAKKVRYFQLYTAPLKNAQ